MLLPVQIMRISLCVHGVITVVHSDIWCAILTMCMCLASPELQ